MFLNLATLQPLNKADFPPGAYLIWISARVRVQMKCQIAVKRTGFVKKHKIPYKNSPVMHFYGCAWQLCVVVANWCS